MHPADINAALQKAGSNQTAVARSLTNRNGRSLTSAAVHHVIKGRSRSERIALCISQVTGIPVGQLWPNKYPVLEAAQERKPARGTTPRKSA